MKIDRFFIENFGVFSTYDVNALSVGLNIFYGANEAGKSTIVEFLRAILFGFRPAYGRKEYYYNSSNNSAKGGRIFLKDQDNQDVIVERLISRREQIQIVMPSGAMGSEEDLRSLLGGADEKLFRSVFAFSLDELRSFESLSGAGIQDKIFSAGVAGAGESAQRVIERLRARNDELLRPRKACRISEICRSLDEAEGKLKKARRRAEDYVAVCTEEKRAEQEAEQIREALKELNSEVQRLELIGKIVSFRAKLTQNGLGSLLAFDDGELDSDLNEVVSPSDLLGAEDMVGRLCLQEERAKELVELNKVLAENREELEKGAKQIGIEPTGTQINSLQESIELLRGRINQNRQLSAAIFGKEQLLGSISQAAAISIELKYFALIIGLIGVGLMIWDLLSGSVLLLFGIVTFIFAITRINQVSIAYLSPHYRRILKEIEDELATLMVAADENIKQCSKQAEMLETFKFGEGKEQGFLQLESELVEVDQRLTQLRTSLEKISSRQSRVDELVGSLSSWGIESYKVLRRLGYKEKGEGDKEQLAKQENDLNSKKAVLNSDLQSLIERRISFAQERAKLESSEELQELELQCEGLKAELSDAVLLWKKNSVAIGLIQKSLDFFVANRQPAVLEEASHFFWQTTSRYLKILQQPEGNRLVVIDSDGASKVPEILSRGTLEQLYLCLRLGLAKEFARRAVALPIIMDDILVNFDSERASSFAKVLISFAQQQQVLFFTCHQSTVELFSKLDESIKLYNLSLI